MSEIGVLKTIAGATLGSRIAIHIPAPWADGIDPAKVIKACQWAIDTIERQEKKIAELKEAIVRFWASQHRQGRSDPIPKSINWGSEFLKANARSNWFNRPGYGREFV